MNDDLRPNPDLDEIFGVISKSAEKAVAADAKIKGDTGGAADGWKERDKPDINEAFGDMTHAAGAKKSDEPQPGKSPSGKPEVDVSDASAKKIGDAVADSVQKKTAGRTENVGNGTPSTTKRDTRPRDEWGRFLPNEEKEPPPPRAGEKAGSKAGSWAGSSVGSVLGTAVGGMIAGPFGAVAGGVIGGGLGEKIGSKVGGELGATGDKAVDVALSPDSKDSLVRVLPDAAQAVVRWYRELDKATETILRYDFQLSQASAAMGAVEAEREARETFRDKEKGDRLSASAEYLSKAEQDRKDNTKGLVILAGKVDNYVQGFKEKLAGAIIAPLNKMAEGVNKLVEYAEGIEEKPLTPEEYMNNAADRSDAMNDQAMAKQRGLSEEMNRNSGRRMY